MSDLTLDFEPCLETPTPKNLASYKTLVLNADGKPLSYYPLSLKPWEWAIKLIHEGAIDPVAYYDDVVVHSAHDEHLVPSVVALKNYVRPPIKVPFTRFNVYLRDSFICQYCGEQFNTNELTFDHVVPRSKGGRTTWDNIASACISCNLIKDNKTCEQAKMFPRVAPYEPTSFEIQKKGRKFPPNYLHSSWADYLYWDAELEP